VLLLDTCTFIWLASDPERLSSGAKRALEKEADIVVSDVSVWEICLKWQAGKIELPSPPRNWVTEQMQTWKFERLAIEPEHLYRSVELSDLHRDPFDRLLVSQALVRSMTIVTPDPAIRQYPVAVSW
jgi:PIN domain nuclease of toxin-antitoxin system